jgi:hypothetical protein
MFDRFRSSRERADLALLVGLVGLALVPLFVGRYLPFFDYPAHLSIPAALRHRADPATEVARLWQLDLRLVPNAFHYAFTWAASFVMPLESASRGFVALFCVAALPAAGAFVLRELERDVRLAMLLVPVCYNQCLWFGFIGFCAALPMSLVALALLDRALRKPSPRLSVGLSTLVALLAFTHFFVLAVTLGLALVVLLNRSREVGLRRVLWAALPLSSGPLLMAPWFLEGLRGGPQPSGGSLGHLWSARPGLGEYARLLHHWFIGGYSNHVDDAMSALLVLALAALLALGPARGVGSGVAAATRRLPLLLAGCLAAGYVALPFEIRAPFHWWGMNVRLLPLLFVWLVVAVAPGPLDPRVRPILLAVAAASTAFISYVAVDIGYVFNGPGEAAGLANVVGALPKGARVLGLYTDYRQRPRYEFYPYAYAALYAVVERGGLATPFIPIPQAWTNPKEVPAFPFAGDAAFFQTVRHLTPYSHFLVRTCQGLGCVPDPLAESSEVRRIAEQGRWRLYACASSNCREPKPDVHFAP